MRLLRLLAPVLFALPLASFAQAPVPTGSITSHVGWPQPRTSDVDSTDHILAALYAVISGPAHQPRDWNRMRSLFVPDARLIPIKIVPGTPDPHTAPATDVVFYTIDGYIARASPIMEAQGFFERGVHNQVEEFSNLVQVFSTYESRHALADPKPFARGVNSIQLVRDSGRLWIVNILWDEERPGVTLPKKYLP